MNQQEAVCLQDWFSPCTVSVCDWTRKCGWDGWEASGEQRSPGKALAFGQTLLARKTNQNGLKRAVCLGPVLPERSHGRLDHKTSTVGEKRREGTSTSGTLPGPEELEALGRVKGSEAHGQLSTAACATPGLTSGPGPGPATAQCIAG